MSKKKVKNREKVYDLGRKVRDPQKKDLFTPYVEPIRGSRAHNMYTTVEKNGKPKLTLYGYYNLNLLDFQNERQLEETTCKSYDNTVCVLIAPAFSGHALEDMDELDYLTCWQTILDSVDSDTKVREAYSLVRMIADYAYRHGDISVTLWGLMPEEGEGLFKKTETGKSPKCVTEEKKVELEKEAKRYADMGIRIPHSISLVTEFKLFLKMLQQTETFGQVLAGLILFITGCRTSEAIAFQFKHLTEVFPGCWALQRINVSQPESRYSEIGGKTHNAFRLLWIPGFLAKLILDKRDYLLTLYSAEEVSELTISCFGLDYKRPCTQKELNSHMKELFRQVGVKEDMIASAFREIRESKENMEEYEKSIVAYLGRHQAITAMIYCGLTEAQICVCAGHEQIDMDVEAYDFANPDVFRELVKALSRRPIIQIFDQMAEYQEICYQGEICPFTSDSWSRIEFQSEREIEFLLSAYSSVGNVGLELADMEGIRIFKKNNLLFPKQKKGKELSIRNDLRIAGIAAYQAAKADLEKSVMTGACVADRLEWIDELADAEVCVYKKTSAEITPLPDVQVLLPKLPLIGSDAFTKATAAVVESEVLCCEEKANQEPELPELPQKKPSRVVAEARYVNSGVQLYVLSGSKELIPVDIKQQRLFKRGTRGQKVLWNQTAEMLYAYQPDASAYLISRSGQIYYVPAGKLLEGPDASYQAVSQEQGILLQDSALGQAGASLVCLTSNGDIVCVAVNSLSGTFPKEGRTLIAAESLAEPQAEVVSACICPAKSDVLLVTQRGQALRLTNETFKVCKSFNLKPIKGISLDEGDRAVACAAYTSDGVLGITANGSGILHRGKDDIHPHGRGSKGVAFVKLREGDHVVSVIVPGQTIALLRSDGFLCCTETTQFPEQGRNSMGVSAMATDRGKNVVAVALLKK